MKNNKHIKILLLDIETSPIISYVWGLWDNNVALNQIKKDWHILSFAAKWLDSDKIFYFDQRNEKNIEDDKKLLEKVWKLLDDADVLIWQNGDKFDKKKLNARFILNGMQPPSSYRSIDTLKIAKKHFAFTSNKLEYLSNKLNTKHKKLKHEQFSGFELWKECLLGNKKAWDEMSTYNKHDVLALEEVYKKLIAWDNNTTINFNVYHSGTETICSCGSTDFRLNGYNYTPTGKFQRYRCKGCGSEVKDSGKKNNKLSKDKREFLKSGVKR